MLAARAEATPAADLALAKRYADILTGVDQDVADPALDGTDDDDADADADDRDDDSDDGRLDDALDNPDLVETSALDDDPLSDDALEDLADDDSPMLGELDLATLYPDPTDLAAQSTAFQTAGGAELFDAWDRHQRPSRFGRFDLDVSWRSYTSEPRTAPHYHAEELWLVATWRR